MKADTPTEQAILETFWRYIEAMRVRNIEAMARLVDRSPDTVIIGTDQGERLIGWDAIRDDQERYWATHPAESEQVTYTSAWQHIGVSPQGDAAWVAMELVMRVEVSATGQVLDVPMRNTAVLIRDEGSPTGWAFSQAHLSVSASVNPQLERLTQQAG